jgi:hypothetical protein
MLEKAHRNLEMVCEKDSAWPTEEAQNPVRVPETLQWAE